MENVTVELFVWRDGPLIMGGGGGWGGVYI